MKHLKTFEKYNPEMFDELMSATEAAPYLVDMSGDKLNYADFKEYIDDYCNNPKSYDIDTTSKYYLAIASAYENMIEDERNEYYQEYLKEFEPWKKSDKLLQTNEPSGVFEKHWNQSNKLSNVDDKMGIFAESKEELDELNIVELVEKYAEKEMVTSDGYGGENKNGFIPEYLAERINKESVELENSYHSYNTFDSYTLRRPRNVNTDLAILIISKKKDRGSSFEVDMVPVKKKEVIEYVADWNKYREMRKK